MVKTTLTIDGMMCSMCESHVNDAIRNEFAVKRVTSSCKKGESEILSEQPLDEAAVRCAVEATGYRVRSYVSEPYEKRGIFGRRG